MGGLRDPDRAMCPPVAPQALEASVLCQPRPKRPACPAAPSRRSHREWAQPQYTQPRALAESSLPVGAAASCPERRLRR